MKWCCLLCGARGDDDPDQHDCGLVFYRPTGEGSEIIMRRDEARAFA